MFPKSCMSGAAALRLYTIFNTFKIANFIGRGETKATRVRKHYCRE